MRPWIAVLALSLTTAAAPAASPQPAKTAAAPAAPSAARRIPRFSGSLRVGGKDVPGRSTPG